MSEVTALLDTQNGKLESLIQAQLYQASAVSQYQEQVNNALYLILGLLAAILAGIGIIYGVKLIRIFLEQVGRWL